MDHNRYGRAIGDDLDVAAGSDTIGETAHLFALVRIYPGIADGDRLWKLISSEYALARLSMAKITF